MDAGILLCYVMRGLSPKLSWPSPAFDWHLCHITVPQSKSQISSSDNSLLTLTRICLSLDEGLEEVLDD